MQENPEKKEQEREQLIELGSDITNGKDGKIYTLTIIGQVEGHQVLPETVKTTKYEHILPLLAGIEESNEIDGLLLLLNTVGGDIEAGLAIAEMIAGMKKPTVSLVLQDTSVMERQQKAKSSSTCFLSAMKSRERVPSL